MCYIPPKWLFDRIWCFCQVGKLQLVNVLDLEVSHVQSPFHWFACQGKIRTKGQLFKVFMNMSWTYSEHTCIQYTHMYIYMYYIYCISIYICYRVGFLEKNCRKPTAGQMTIKYALLVSCNAEIQDYHACTKNKSWLYIQTKLCTHRYTFIYIYIICEGL